MTQNENNLLLYVEDCAVNKSGAMAPIHMNADDLTILDAWNDTGFVKSGRIKFDGLPGRSDRKMWCKLSLQAMAQAHALRAERAERNWKSKGYEVEK